MTRQEIKDALRGPLYPPGTIVKLDDGTVMVVTQDGYHAQVGTVVGTTITWGPRHYIG